jgi:hypothetical protein
MASVNNAMEVAMIIQVHHNEDGAFVHVADVFVATLTEVQRALDYAYFRTQNIEGSWSRGAVFEDGEHNGDFSKDTTVIAPLHVYQGKTFGLRSSMVGDRFTLGHMTYEVAPIGFKPV